MRFQENSKILGEHLDFLKHLLEMIYAGATGFDLAYEVEKNQRIKNIIYEGVLFYNTFLEIGNRTFIDAPDKIKVDYRSFKTIEDTEKYIFMVWLMDVIESLEKKNKFKSEYNKYLETQDERELKARRVELPDDFDYCRNCGAKILSKDQKYCEKCGIDLIKSLLK
ncbi:MAG: zinc ribbon domain-containing protein [Promethearchaeota archaeon]